MKEDEENTELASSPIIDEERTITLVKPVKVGDVEYANITLREPTFAELKKARKGETDDLAVVGKLISIVGAIPMAAVDQFRQRDLTRCADFFGLFGASDSQNPTSTAPSPT